MNPIPKSDVRDNYRFFHVTQTRWMDNDVYGHVNNVVYYSFFDTAVAAFLLKSAELDFAQDQTIALVVETGCTYFSSIAFPDEVTVGVRVAKLGTSSVRYELAIFKNNEAMASATGHFVHVYVDRAAQRPVPMAPKVRSALQAIAVIKGNE